MSVPTLHFRLMAGVRGDCNCKGKDYFSFSQGNCCKVLCGDEKTDTFPVTWLHCNHVTF